LVFVLPWPRLRRAMLPLSASIHFLLTLSCHLRSPAAALQGMLALDELGLLFLSTTSTIYLIVSVYTVGFLAREPAGKRRDALSRGVFSNAPETIFIACLSLFLSAMTLVTVSQNFGILWVGIESTTLATAPLIYFHRHNRSLEATWKYLLICSVGIAIALLGTLFLSVAGQLSAHPELGMDLSALLSAAQSMDSAWLRGAFLLMLVGYGTKMGLAPVHSWLPDAHSEAPSAVSALLSGALLNCAFLGILRMQQVLEAAGMGSFGRELLLVFGLLSMLFGALFLIGQSDFKRLLAYSSVEHMGILAVGVGVGDAGVSGALFHMVVHSLAKSLLFLVAGNTLAAYGTRALAEVRGVFAHRPGTGALWLVGLFAIVGSPPFGPFISELVVLRAALSSGQWLVAILFLGALSLAFIGMSGAVLRMVQGSGPAPRLTTPEPWSSLAPPMLLAGLVLLLGVWLPAPLTTLLHDAARALGGGAF
jgi:hydrogenase-4 component F